MIDENTSAEMSMDFVRICRKSRTVETVWREMQTLYPDYDIEEIKTAMSPVIKRMFEFYR